MQESDEATGKPPAGTFPSETAVGAPKKRALRKRSGRSLSCTEGPRRKHLLSPFPGGRERKARNRKELPPFSIRKRLRSRGKGFAAVWRLGRRRPVFHGGREERATGRNESAPFRYDKLFRPHQHRPPPKPLSHTFPASFPPLPPEAASAVCSADGAGKRAETGSPKEVVIGRRDFRTVGIRRRSRLSRRRDAGRAFPGRGP